MALVSTDWWCWKAAGVPPEQRQLIVTDHESTLTPSQRQRMTKRQITGEAIFRFLEDTLDPVANHTLLSRDNYFYHLVLQGKYTKQCAPRWLSERAHRRLSREHANRLDGLRIHTDEFLEVIRRMRGGSVSAVIVMDSMDWLEVPDTTAVKHVKFTDRRSNHDAADRNQSRSRSKSRSTEGTDAAQTQIDAIHRVLRVGGKVLLRSAALKPWYIDLFARMEDEDSDSGQKLWRVTCMGRREHGKCIDRVNMYASCWLLVKIGEGAAPPGSPTSKMKSALKRRRTGSGGSEASSSGSEWAHASPEVLRGRKSGVQGDDGDGEETETETEKDVGRKRGVLEDMMLPGAAMGGDDGERF